MKDLCEGILLRIFLGESDKIEGRPLYEDIVLKAKQKGLAGATVFRGIMGYGADSRFHSAKFLRLSEDLPIVIEIVDKKEKIDDFLTYLDAVIEEGLVTIEKANVVMYRNKK